MKIKENSINQPSQNRRSNRSSQEGKTKKHLGLRILIAVLALMTTALSAAVFYVFLTLKTVPKVDTQELSVYGNARIVDKNGNPIWEMTSKEIDTVSYDQIPPLYRDGLIAVEDKNYWTEKGDSLSGMANAAASFILSRFGLVKARGGSTLDQQLIKNVYFDGGYGIPTTTRKIQEIYLAKQLNHNFTKKQILTFYVNHLEYAENAQGLAAAAKIYFGKSMADLNQRTNVNIAQTAYLVGLGQAPTSYNLYANPSLANWRKNVVLSVMKKAKLISKSECKKAKAIDVAKTAKKRGWLTRQKQAKNRTYKFYTDQVLYDLKNRGYDINNLSMTVHTFLDPAKYKKIIKYLEQDQYYQDGARRKEQGAVSVVDKNGIVVAIAGSRLQKSEYNRALQTNRSSGSSAKPFTAYGPLFEFLGSSYTTASRISAAPYLYPGTNTYMYNYGKENPGMVTLQTALRQSLNTPVGRIDDQILGSVRMKAFLSRVGLDVKDSYSSVDGIGIDISTLDAAAAYNAINNDGIYIKPRTIDYIQFADGSKKVFKAEKTRAMSKGVSYILSQMLRGVVTRQGTASDVYMKNWQGFAAKTGSVAFEKEHLNQPYGEGGSDVWFDSITNRGYSVSVWQGYDNPMSSPAVSDNFHGAQKLGRDIQKWLTGETVISNWSMPDSVSKISGSGLNANYKFTESQDLGANYASLSAKPISGLDDFAAVSLASSTSQINWKTQARKSKLYNLYSVDPSIMNDPNVIDPDLYRILAK